MEYVGHHGRYDQLVIRGSLEGRTSARSGRRRRTRHRGMHVNDWDAIDPMRELVETGGALPAA